jgi:hypothetical protein
MATLVINDLSESVELDRQAMGAITGGSMAQAHQTMFTRRQMFTGLAIGTISTIGTLVNAAALAPLGETNAPRVRTTLFR